MFLHAGAGHGEGRSGPRIYVAILIVAGIVVAGIVAEFAFRRLPLAAAVQSLPDLGILGNSSRLLRQRPLATRLEAEPQAAAVP